MNLYVVSTTASILIGWHKVYVVAKDFQDAAAEVKDYMEMKGLTAYKITGVVQINRFVPLP